MLAVDSPLYMNYRCNAFQVRQAKIIVCKLLSLKLIHLALSWKQVVYFVLAGANQAAAPNFWEVWASCWKCTAYFCLLAVCANSMYASKILLCIRGEGLPACHEETLERSPSPSWWSRSTSCWEKLSTRFSIGGQYSPCQLVFLDQACQQVIWCICKLALCIAWLARLKLQGPHGLVFIAEFKIGLNEKAQPEALRYHEHLWEENYPESLNQSFAATFVIEMMGAGLRC